MINKLDTNNLELNDYISENEISTQYNDILELLNNNDEIISDSNFQISLKKIDQNDINQEKVFSKENIFLSFKSQLSTKNLQNNILCASKEIINYIIKELKGKFREIIKDKNGNYFFSSLIKICGKEQRFVIIKELSNTICDDCIDEFGTHALQTLIETASSEEEFNLLLSSFNDCNKIAVATMNQYGTYVIRKLIKNAPESIRTQFNLLFVKLICIFSRNKFGVFAVQKFITYTKNNIIIKEFKNSIMTNFINLAENQYGNYLIQYILNKWWEKKEGILIKREIKNKFKILMNNQYSFYICKLYVKLENNSKK